MSTTPLPFPAPSAYARRLARLTPSAVREILRVAQRPDILSFAGGLPAPELFPVEAIALAQAKVLAESGRDALQYSVTEGFGPLREWVAARLRHRGIAADAENLVITCGAQQALDLVARILLDPGDRVIVENPTYLAALQVFDLCEAEVRAIGSDDGGMRVDELEEAIERHRPKMVYVVSDFANPKGTTLARERRATLARIASAHGVLVLEDDPYGELRFRGEAIAPVAAADPDRVAYLGTFSKTLAPGLRLGWLHGPPELVRRAALVKQAADLHTATLAQRTAAKLLETFDYDAHLEKLRSTYGERAAAMQAAIRRWLPPGTRVTDPEGGLFLWLELPGGLDADRLLPDAVAEKIAFVPGSSFFVGEGRREFVRLNFSNRSPVHIEEGMRRLGAVVTRALGARVAG